jgi:enoyl-CoA hydratase/carnithine racemase
MTEASGTEPLVLYEAGPVAYITMNRPRYRNAQNSAMTYALDAAFGQAGGDDQVKVIVLQGAGDHFSAGHDIGSPGRDHDQSFPRTASHWWDHAGQPGAEARMPREYEQYIEMCRRWRDLPKPTIAKVQGACLAGGLALAWICDLIIASEDAFFADAGAQFGSNGIEYFAHPWVMSPRFAKEFLFMARRVGAEEARSWGMVNRVVPRERLDQEVAGVAGRIAEMSRFGLAITKRSINNAEDLMGLRAGIEAAFALHLLSHSHAAESGVQLDPAKIRESFKAG